MIGVNCGERNILYSLMIHKYMCVSLIMHIHVFCRSIDFLGFVYAFTMKILMICNCKNPAVSLYKYLLWRFHKMLEQFY